MADISDNPNKACNTCKKADTELLRCAKCKQVYYCNIDCQKQDWGVHRKNCKLPNSQHSDQSSNKENMNNKNKEGLGEFGKLEHVGSGNFSEIFKTKSKADGQIYAIKQIEKNKVQRMRKQADVFMEKHCLTKLKQCEHVVRLYKTFQDQLSVYFQMEFPEKGELWEQSKSFGIIPESMYKYYASSVVKAVSVIHNQYNIVHRDLKPENILLDKNYQIKLIDFGTAKDLDRPDIKGAGNGLKGKKPFEHYVGTPHYMAPECIHNKASQKSSDIYSLGGVLYFLKVGSPPFQGGSEYLTFTKTLQKKLLTCPQLFNPQLQDLIGQMNEKQMDKRPTINQVMKHAYFKDIDFNNMGSYKNAIEGINESEKYLQELSFELLTILEKHKEPKIEERKRIFAEQVEPILKKEIEKVEGDKQKKQRLEMMELQCKTYLNLDDNTNISFTQLYENYRKGTRTQL